MEVLIRVYEELNNYLSPERRKVTFSDTFDPGISIKDVIDKLGIPSDEVDLVLANEESVDLSHHPGNGDRISLYPVFESIDISPFVKIRAQPVHGELVILPEIKHFLALLLDASSPNLTRHGESIRYFRPHPGLLCQTAQAGRRESARLRKSPSEAATPYHRTLPETCAKPHPS
jgi:hypothetical protein